MTCLNLAIGSAAMRRQSFLTHSWGRALRTASVFTLIEDSVQATGPTAAMVVSGSWPYQRSLVVRSSYISLIIYN